MSIKINIHKTHCQFTSGLDIVKVEGSTVGACLDNLARKYAGMGKALFDKKGKLLNYIEVYVNLKSTYPDELSKQVKDGDNIHITFMVVGG
ncbi:MAG TPA: ThiS family protein [Desulfobacteraceae bacterium]|nr:ThiS family protein [Desulfobacteraceae bacterium]